MALPRLPDQMLEQQAGDTVPVHLVRDGGRDLRDAGLPSGFVGDAAGR
jgi:hypothetical protein